MNRDEYFAVCHPTDDCHVGFSGADTRDISLAELDLLRVLLDYVFSTTPVQKIPLLQRDSPAIVFLHLKGRTTLDRLFSNQEAIH